ncbi:Histone deacetylase complex subunit [Knufia obscura]|uniref:Histone deacetylase complex subunit n=1 Tax=Knufia obscura TaxID=1635080 RepID=A0ABR0RWR5_9EURO|nr:Histone deacetylase complex subunit [Knufia obscura]
MDEADAMSRSEQSAPRRSRRGAEQEKEVSIKQPPVEDDDNEAIEDDVTRCICGHADYPGPSQGIRDQYGTAALTEDMGNFFVQCDNCHVWQHGGCMGLHDESIIPDEYYCEKCRPDFHKVIKPNNIRSTKSSRYLPVLEGSSRTAPLTPADQARMKDLRNKALQNTKRRATMNSRTAYDEDEALRQAIEESKADGTLGKRSREDAEDHRPTNKRQRTVSSNSDASSKRSHSPEPEKVLLGKNGTKLRGAAARNNREKELREKQKQDVAAQKAEAANKRNARSERRRVDESPPPTPTISPSKPTESKSSKSKADTPQPVKAKARGGARPGARGKRVGRNQYTRDLYDPSDTHRLDSDRNGHHSPHGTNGESGRSSKARTHPARMSLNEMKKRVAAIMEFTSQMQTQHSSSNSNASKNSSSNPNGSGNHSRSSDGRKGNSTPSGTQLGGTPTSKLIEAVTAGLQDVDDGKIPFVNEAEFTKLGSTQMMEALMKELVGWQSQYGVYSR